MNLELAIRLCVGIPRAHARLLNTFSMMEYIGATRISWSHGQSRLSLEVLRHFADEARHACFFKAQIERLGVPGFQSYSKHDTFATIASLQYIPRIDSGVSRMLLKDTSFRGSDLRNCAYLLVTHAVESRALQIYPQFEEILQDLRSPVSLKSVLLEEQNHMAQILEGIKKLGGSLWRQLIHHALEIEGRCFHRWQAALVKEILTDPMTSAATRSNSGESSSRVYKQTPMIRRNLRKSDELSR